MPAVSKDDTPTPAVVPTKRRPVREALDKWLAEWLTRDDLLPSTRRLLEGERERRRKARKAGPDVDVGLLIGAEGTTPDQLAFIVGYLVTTGPASIIHAGVSKRLAAEFPDGVPEVGAPDFEAVVRAATVVLAAPKEPAEPNGPKAGVWAGVKYARHRGVPVRIVLPDGKEA